MTHEFHHILTIGMGGSQLYSQKRVKTLHYLTLFLG